MEFRCRRLRSKKGDESSGQYITWTHSFRSYWVDHQVFRIRTSMPSYQILSKTRNSQLKVLYQRQWKRRERNTSTVPFDPYVFNSGKYTTNYTARLPRKDKHSRRYWRPSPLSTTIWRIGGGIFQPLICRFCLPRKRRTSFTYPLREHTSHWHTISAYV